MTRPVVPTGRIVENLEGLDLVATRILPGSVEDAWASITEPERTARWVGRWRGVGAPGETVEVQMGFEDGAPWEQMTVTECTAPHRLRLLGAPEGGGWDVAFELTAAGEASELTFTHHGVVPGEVGDLGPGWEYYLDRLVASVTDAPEPDWDDYFPALREHFEAQLR